MILNYIESLETGPAVQSRTMRRFSPAVRVCPWRVRVLGNCGGIGLSDVSCRRRTNPESRSRTAQPLLGAISMSLLNRCQKLLAGGESLRPIDYLVLMAIFMLTFIKFWW